IEDGMRGVLDVDRTGREVPDVALEDDLPHELMKEWGHLEPIELAEQGRVMKADPPDGALFHRLLEGGLGHRRPAIRRVIDLDEHIVSGEVRIVDWIGGAN